MQMRDNLLLNYLKYRNVNTCCTYMHSNGIGYDV